ESGRDDRDVEVDTLGEHTGLGQRGSLADDGETVVTQKLDEAAPRQLVVVHDKHAQWIAHRGFSLWAGTLPDQGWGWLWTHLQPCRRSPGTPRSGTRRRQSFRMCDVSKGAAGATRR